MTEPDLIQLFAEPLERIGLRYMITGGVASVVYGEPRFTRDIDVVLELSRADIPRLAQAFGAADFYVPPLETMEEEASRARFGHFNVIHHETALRADVYLQGDDPLHAWAFPRRARVRIGDLDVWMAPLEYVILRKLLYFRDSGSDRHLRDVAAMLRLNESVIDRASLDTWIDRLALGATLDQAIKLRP